MGRLKDASTRSRRNVSTTRAVLPSHGPVEVPSLPDGDWHEMTVRWWRDVWASPMANEYLIGDIAGLYRLAMMVDSFWRNPSASASAEIRLSQRAYGLTPMDRRRLEWTIESAENARDRRRTLAVPQFG